MAKEEKQINIRVKDGEQFYANETGINFTPTEIILDFKCINNVQDIANHRALVLKHNLVILTPYLTKSFMQVLNRAVEDYEKKFGEIKKPKEIDKAEKIIKKEKEKIDNIVEERDDGETYFG
ncbi:MAG TPA: DUF3467 domain-containing protein [Candidatus Nanoarchaeia archaeon]|nr:DUF3467 domain-containing protein [Candidatus Nanoarchaeia archaeon]